MKISARVLPWENPGSSPGKIYEHKLFRFGTYEVPIVGTYVGTYFSNIYQFPN